MNALSVPLYLMLYLNFSLPPLQDLVAGISAALMRVMGFQVLLNGFLIGLLFDSKNYTFEIGMDCTGWKAIYFLTALAASTPKSGRLKFLGLALPLLFILNIFRIVSTIALSLHLGIGFLEIIHSIFWRIGLIGVVIVLWLIWCKGKL
jgi:exosortase/archaeosortase family protein